MMKNSSSKRDDEETRKEKSRNRYRANATLLSHLSEATEEHDTWSTHPLPPCNFHWNDNDKVYEEVPVDPQEFEEAEEEFSNRLDNLQTEGQSVHFVSIPSSQRRSSRPEKIIVGHIVIIKLDQSSNETSPPWYVAEVTKVTSDENNSNDVELEVHEYGSLVVPTSSNIGTLKHAKRWKQTMSGNIEVDVMCPNKPKNSKAVFSSVSHFAVADWDVSANILTLNGRIKVGILKSLSDNTHVNYSYKR
jgi:hypothetical protein